MGVREDKVRAVDELAERLSRSSIAILTDYRGLGVSQMGALRRKLRQAGVEYQVTKNTLTRFAAQRVGREGVVPDLEGPTAIAFGFDEPVDTARAVVEYVRTSRVLKVKAAVLDSRRLGPEEVILLADLPPKDVLRAQLVGSIQGPMAGVVGAVNSLLTSVVFALDQRAEQMGGAEA